jgi:transposase InsO family protein
VEVDTRFSHIQVIEVMRNLFRMFGPPKYFSTDNASEFIAKTLSCWLKEQEMTSRFIEPGSPWQNRRNERFNGNLWDEFLNQELFHNVDNASALVKCVRPAKNLLCTSVSLVVFRNHREST